MDVCIQVIDRVSAEIERVTADQVDAGKDEPNPALERRRVLERDLDACKKKKGHDQICKCKTEVGGKGPQNGSVLPPPQKKTPPTGKVSDFFALWREEATKNGTLVARILELAERLMGSKEAVEAWLIRQMQALGQQRPIDAMGTPKGAQLVLETLHRVQHGVYS